MIHEDGYLKAERLIRHWAARGRYHFWTSEAAGALGVSLPAVRGALRRLQAKGAIASPQRGFYVVVPPEYQQLGSLPAEQFIPQLMDELRVPYYAGLLTAARYHGAAHQQPQQFQVVVPKNRPPLRSGRVEVLFVARRNAAQMPTAEVKTPRGFLRISSPEATAFDLVGYPQHCGGLDNVATVLVELGEKLDADRLAAIAPMSPLPWSQRLGYLLERSGHGGLGERLADFVAEHATNSTPLVPGRHQSAPRDPRWKLWINSEVEPDL